MHPDLLGQWPCFILAADSLLLQPCEREGFALQHGDSALGLQCSTAACGRTAAGISDRIVALPPLSCSRFAAFASLLLRSLATCLRLAAALGFQLTSRTSPMASKRNCEVAWMRPLLDAQSQISRDSSQRPAKSGQSTLLAQARVSRSGTTSSQRSRRRTFAPKILDV